MKAAVDASFLFSLYFERESSEQALEVFGEATVVFLLSPLAEFEFRHAVAFEIWLRTQDHNRGLTTETGLVGISLFELDFESKLLLRSDFDLAKVLSRAIALSDQHAARVGIRAMDVLYIAATLEARCQAFASFDHRQHQVAAAEGLVLLPHSLT